jgi:uncharacterized protein YecE (DUF72 family)
VAHSIRIGTSGWLYRSWRGAFYPEGVPQRRWLEYLARTFDTVELNSTFYSLKRPSDFRSWADQVPDDFEFAVKGSRYITHMKRLRDVDEALKRFFDQGLFDLGPKLGPILWQLPRTTSYDAGRVEEFVGRLPRRRGSHQLRHALEARHDSFFVPEVVDLLRENNIALVISHAVGAFPWAEELTGDLVYVRLHGTKGLYRGHYGDGRLDSWARKLKRWSQDRDVRVYFDNDQAAAAPADARRLRDRLDLDRPVSAARPGDRPEPE